VAVFGLADLGQVIGRGERTMLFDNFEGTDKVVVALSKILATRLFDSGL
jgi:hypothetical protein